MGKKLEKFMDKLMVGVIGFTLIYVLIHIIWLIIRARIFVAGLL